MKIKKILVLLDGSKNSLRGLDLAITLAQPLNAAITGLFCNQFKSFLEINEIKPLDKAIFDSVNRKKHTEIQQIMESASQKVEKKVPFESKIIDGKIGPSIIKFAVKNNFDLIVIGSRGMGATKEILLGSVSNYIIHTSQIPTVIVK